MLPCTNSFEPTFDIFESVEIVYEVVGTLPPTYFVISSQVWPTLQVGPVGSTLNLALHSFQTNHLSSAISKLVDLNCHTTCSEYSVKVAIVPRRYDLAPVSTRYIELAHASVLMP